MADGHPQAHFVRQMLQLHLPQAGAGAVAATTIGDDEQLLRLRIAHTPHLEPPRPNGRDREGGGVMRHPDAHPAFVGAHVVDAIGQGLAQFLVHKVMDAHPRWLPLGVPLSPGILEVPHQLLLLRVYGDDR